MEESKKLSLGNNYEVTLSKNSTSLTQDVAIVNDLFNQELHKKPSLLESLTGNSHAKEIQKIRSKMLQLAAGEKVEVYNQYLTAKLTFIKEQVDAGVMKVKADARRKVASNLIMAMDQLESDSWVYQQRFVEEIEKKYAFAKTIRNDQSRKKFEDLIARRENQYYEFIENLISKFHAIAHQTIGEY